MRLYIVVQIVESLYFAQVGHRNLYLVGLLDNGHQIDQTQAVERKRFLHIGFRLKSILFNFKFF